jgi:hypothetical protein
MSKYVITRDANDEIGGRVRAGRVYVTGPHFDGTVFSSTEDLSKASRFSLVETYLLLQQQGKWRGCNPRVKVPGEEP